MVGARPVTKQVQQEQAQEQAQEQTQEQARVKGQKPQPQEPVDVPVLFGKRSVSR